MILTFYYLLSLAPGDNNLHFQPCDTLLCAVSRCFISCLLFSAGQFFGRGAGFKLDG